MPPKRSTDVSPFRARAAWGLPLALAVSMTWTGVQATSASHSPLALLAVAGLYGLLATALFLAARFAVRAGRVFGAGACLALALAPAAQLRLDAGLLQHPAVLAGFVVLVGALAYAWLRASAPAVSSVAPRLLVQAYAAFAALAGATALSARANSELRWHLFEHHRIFGGVLYALDARPLLAEREALWERRGRLAQPAERLDPAHADPVIFHRPPHVVFLLLDTLRADALAPLGGRADVMPAMSALAERSVLFTDVHANASWTRASCASIFTGLLPEEHGAARFHEALSEQWVTLPEELSAAGYQTAAFVANWVQVGRETGFAQGFEAADFHELMSGEEIRTQAGPAAHGLELRATYARAETIGRAALDWVASDARDPNRPLFLYLHYLDPHTPYIEPPEPGTLGDAHERKRGLYRQQLRYLDRQLDWFLRELDGVLSGPKVIVFTSDHGEEFWEHDEWGHGHALYRECVWIPLFVRLPGARPARVDAPLEGRDLYALVRDVVCTPQLDLTAWGAEHARAVRYASQYLDRVEDARPDKKWTGLRRVDADGSCLIWSAFGPTLELYDRTTDPGEHVNRVDDYPARAAALAELLERSVRFWTAPTVVKRTERELEFLRALGYAGGTEADAP